MGLQRDMTEHVHVHTHTHTHTHPLTNNKRTKIYKGMTKVNFRIVVASEVKEGEGRKEKRARFVCLFVFCKILS